ncbi:MAG: hypothetical protein ACK4WH_05910 [Phycisphaerales bacterium]
MTTTQPGEAMPRAGKPISKRRRRLFIAASLLFPLVLLLLIEAALRLAGFGGYPPTFRRVGRLADGSTLVIADNPGPASYFFANRSRPGTLHQSALVMPKPEGTFRVVLAGESAMKGFPQPRALSAGSFLEAMLGDVWPGRTVEVINLGTTAVASYPVLGMLSESLDYDPDLCVVYVGNNEFFGAYGVASLHSAARTPAGIRLVRAFRRLAIAQAIDAVRAGEEAVADRTLMEAMMARAFIAADDPVREDAARNLGAFTAEMIDRCRERGVPVIVCTLPANERDLAPLGEPDVSRLSEADREKLKRLLASDKVADVEAAVALCPTNAVAHHRLGVAKRAAGDDAGAAESFRRAVDLDTMPWRPPSASDQALRDAAKRPGATLCDLRAAFRAASPGGSIGWELMDDHVHPTLAGQHLIAREIVRTMTSMPGRCGVSTAAFEALGTFEQFADRLGANPYDEYGAAHTMRVLGRIPFVQQTNPELFARSDRLCGRIIESQPEEVRSAMRDWQKPETHKGEQRPISGMVARALVQRREFAAAEPLFDVAARSVSLYSSWNIEFTYFRLVCRERARGKLDERDLADAQAAIRRGEFLLGQGRSESGQAERFVGRLCQLRREYERAIPFLLTAREKLGGTDLVANDQALVESYVRTGKVDAARAIIQNGIDRSGPYADLYRRMSALLLQPPQPPARSPAPPPR